jgi:ubiquinone biosynthesis monooxygenase Coq7
MISEARLFDRHLRVIHALEKGATGVYWGHRLVASVFFRDIVPELSKMHAHEMEHFALFGALIRSRGSRKALFPVLWCAGGIAYGALTALGGRRAVWKSTAVIENVAERELLKAAAFFQDRDREIYDAIQTILIDERQHKERGQESILGAGSIEGLVESAARASTKVSKTLAEKL